MIAMRVLIVLLSVLLVANARILSRRSEDDRGKSLEVEELSTETPVFETSQRPTFETSEEQEYVTSEAPEYGTTETYGSTGFDYLWNDTYTESYNPDVYNIECGYINQTVFYLDAFDYSMATFNVSSNTLENSTYSNNQACTIQFVAGANPAWLSVYLEEFDLENSTRCYYDYLCIKGVKICGRSSYPNYYSFGVPANETITLKFHTDSSVTSNGFRFLIYTYQYSGNFSSYEPYGIISYPNAVYNYREVTSDNYVDNCLNENDPIYDTYPDYGYPTTSRPYNTDSPNDVSEQVIECYDGNTESSYYLTSNNDIVSDPSGSSYNINDYFTNSNNRYVLTTPNFGAGGYGNNTSCKIHFYTTSVPQRLSVFFSEFDVESTSNCYYDYLCVNGVNFCGNWEQYRSFHYDIAAYSSFTIRFSSDNSIDRSGVKAYLTFEDTYSSYSNYEATSGDGSQESSVVYSYTDIYSYQDRCSDSYRPPTSSSYPTYYTDYNGGYTTDSGDSNNYRERYIDAIESNLEKADERLQIAKELVQELPSED